MQEGTAQAERTITVLSAAYLESQFGSVEWQVAWASDPSVAQRKLLVTRVEDCARPGLLSGVVSVDMFGRTEADAKATLRVMVAAAIKGRAKPAMAPRFPGRAIAGAPAVPRRAPGRVEDPAAKSKFHWPRCGACRPGAGLASRPTATVQALRGMGGIGKTQLATEFAHARASDYELAYFIAAEEPATIADQFSDLAERLGLDLVPDPEVLQAQVHDRLQAVPGWLLIFDNANAVDDIRAWLPGGPMPLGTAGHVIVTTRRAGFAAIGHVMELDVIDLESAVALLRTRVQQLPEQTGRQIAEELGQLPLALEQAAAYLDRSAMPPADYLDLLRQRAKEMYERGQVSGRHETIATLWDITLERVSAQDPAAVVLLDLCAYLAPEPIPLDLFSSHADLLPAPLSAAAADPLAFGEVIATLVDYSLAKRTPSGLQLHRLVQGVIRARHAYTSASAKPTAHDQ